MVGLGSGYDYRLYDFVVKDNFLSGLIEEGCEVCNIFSGWGIKFFNFGVVWCLL